MGSGEITDAVRQFVSRHIDSIEQLEVLLLLRRDPDREWTAGEVSRELRTSAVSAGRRLAGLSEGGLLSERPEGGPAYRYHPSTGELEDAAREVAEAYAVRRIAVTNLIYSRPLDQVRTFADAFKIRED